MAWYRTELSDTVSEINTSNNSVKMITTIIGPIVIIMMILITTWDPSSSRRQATYVGQIQKEGDDHVDQQWHLSHLKIGIRIITFDFQMTWFDQNSAESWKNGVIWWWGSEWGWIDQQNHLSNLKIKSNLTHLKSSEASGPRWPKQMSNLNQMGENPTFPKRMRMNMRKTLESLGHQAGQHLRGVVRYSTSGI